MEWMIDFLCALVLTTLTGSILMAVWYVIGKRPDAMGHINILYHILRWNTVFFCVPVAYLALRAMDEWAGSFQGHLFLRTPQILAVARWVLVGWLLGALAALGYLLVTCVQLHLRCKAALPASAETNRLLRSVCQELGIRGERVSVVRSYQAQVPYLVGVATPKVVLPVEDYSEEELRITFIHELTHYQQRDLWMKWASMILLCIQWFNPAVWWHHRIVKRWSEYACDYRAYPKAGSARAYLEVMGRIALNATDQSNALVAAWYENRPELLARVERVARYQKLSPQEPGRMAWICAVMLAVNVLAVGTTAVAAAHAYLEVYRETEDLQEEPLEETERLAEMQEEYHPDFDREDLADTRDEINRKMNAVHWYVGAHTLKKTTYITGVVGREMEVHVSALPSDVEIRVGILSQDGTKHYVAGTESLTHTFDIGGQRWYQFFVENMGDWDVEVIGTYVIR